MTELEKTTTGNTVGSAVPVPEGVTVVWPDGTERTVTGGVFVFDQAGTFNIDGKDVEAS